METVFDFINREFALDIYVEIYDMGGKGKILFEGFVKDFFLEGRKKCRGFYYESHLYLGNDVYRVYVR